MNIATGFLSHRVKFFDEPIKFTVKALIPCGRGRNQSATHSTDLGWLFVWPEVRVGNLIKP